MGLGQLHPEVVVLRVHVPALGKHFIGLGFQFLGGLLALLLGHYLLGVFVLLGGQFIFQLLHSFLIISVFIRQQGTDVLDFLRIFLIEIFYATDLLDKFLA